MKIDYTKAKKCVTEVPADCKALIDKLLECDDDDLIEFLSCTSWWTVGKCELYHWVDVLNRFDSILQAATAAADSEWSLPVNTDERLQKLTLCVLHFTSLLIEYSFSRHLYNSMEHLVTLLSSSNLDIILSVLNLLYVFSKRSNFLSRLSDKQRLPLLKKLGYLAENWGGKENGFGLADAAKDLPNSAYPRNATTLHYEFYAEPTEDGKLDSLQSTVYCIHIENVDELSSSPADIMESLLEMYPVPGDKRMLLYTHLRLAYSFSKRDSRLKCIQARLHSISVLVYMNSLQTSANNIPNILYNGFIEELVDILQVPDTDIVDIKAAALRTLTSIVHLECRDRTPRVGTVVDATGVAQYHGFLPVLVRRCIKKMTEKNSDPGPAEFTPNFTTALFSFLYHLSSYENGGEALVQSGMMAPLLNVVITMGDQQEQTTFVTRAVRVVDLITNVEWQTFQGLDGLQIFIDRLKHEVDVCRGETAEGEKGIQCLPQRAALFKSILNFLKKAISDHVFGEEIRHIMDGCLPDSLKHLVDNVEYYGPSLFLLAMEVVTVYVFQEPSLLSVLQENGITDAMLNALLVKDPPATREVLASLPNVFSALCLNARGLESFVNHKPFERLFKVMLSPNYLLAMRTRRGSNPVDRDTASNLGNAMDELMRHQPTLRTDAMKAIIELLNQLKALGHDPNTVCTKLAPSKSEASGSSNPTPFETLLGGEDTESEDEDAAASRKPAALAQTFAASESKQLVPLLDYIHNVMKFIQAIVSNNATDDHCQEFQTHGGLPILFQLLHLPALPMDFPSSPACQSVANLVKSIMTLSRKEHVFIEGLAEFNNILTQLEVLYSPTDVKRDESLWEIANGSVVFYELASAPVGSDPSDIPLIQTLVHAHAFIMVLLHISRTSQNDIRSLLVSQWAGHSGLGILARLNELYCCLIWEATMLMTFCPKSDETQVCEPAAKLRTMLIARSNAQGKGKDMKQKGEAMEEDGKNAGPWNAFQKVVRSVVLAASRLGRSMAELFGLLAKLSIGIPLRQRYRHNIPYYPTPARTASYTVAEKLSELLKMGMEWSLPCQRESARYRISFLNCTIGFTMDMLFDERKYAYHLMLQYFHQSGTSKAFFQCFEWALNTPNLEKKPDLPSDLSQTATLDVFCQIWLGLLERLVNPRNILESPHNITEETSQTKDQRKTFNPTEFLLEIHMASLEALRALWSNKKLEKLSANPQSCDSILLILTYLIRGEKTIKEKMQIKTTDKEAAGEISLRPPPAVSRVLNVLHGNRPNPQDSQYFQQMYRVAYGQDYTFLLVDMGFPRASVTEALRHTQTLEAATEWILSHSEDIELMQAISMSLETSVPAEEETTPKEEKQDKEMKPAEVEQPGTSKESKPNHDRYLNGQELDSFMDDILHCCLFLLDSFPNSVYRVYEVFEAIMKRNGPEWTGEKNIFQNILKEIGESCDFLLQGSSTSTGLANSELEAHKRLSSRCLLLSLLFQGSQFSDLCAEALHENRIIQKLVQILQTGSYCLLTGGKKQEGTPDWISSTLLLIDLYERSCVHKQRYKSLARYTDYNRTWKWFDDRSGRWCNYSPTNQKILNDAYKEGSSKIQFTAGRRRYTVNFQQMIQVNEESGNRRPIIVMFNKPKKAGGSESKTSVNSEPEKEDLTMETDAGTSSQSADTIWQGLTEEQSRSLLQSCTALLKVPIRGDTVHAAMRLLLRLTRSDKPGGHERAITFVKLDGPQALLNMTKQSEFSGFMSLATLIFCHIFEDLETLKYAMEKTVKIASTRGVPNQSSGVSATTIGNREMHYVLQALAPMACRHPETFVDVCKHHFKIAMPNSKTSRVEEEETRMMNNNAVQLLELVKDAINQTKPKPTLNHMTKHILQLLLNALVKSEGSKLNLGESIGKQHSKSASSVMSMARHLRQAADDMHRRYSESEAAAIRQEERSAVHRQSSVAPDMDEGSPHCSQEMTDVFYPSESQDSDMTTQKSEGEKVKTADKSEPLFSKSGILRLLAELVSSYPACTNFIVYHTYPAGSSSLVKQDTSCLAYILHHLLPPSNKSQKKDEINTNNADAKNAQNEKDCCSSLARVLLTSLACCHPKQSTQNTVISEVKSALHKILLMPESIAKHNTLRSILSLVNNMIECASKMAHGNDGSMPPAVVEDPTNLARVMISRGLATDLAQISNYIDLGSPNMADSVNAALKPLEVLSRLVHSSGPNTPKPSTSNAKPDESEATTSSTSQPVPVSQDSVHQAEEIATQLSADTIRAASALLEEANDTFELSEASVDMNEDSNAFDVGHDDGASDGINESMVGDFPIVPDSAGQDFTPDLLLSQNTNQNVVEVDMHVIEEDTIDEDDQDSSTSDDPTEEINNEDQELEDDASEMDDIDDDDDEDEDEESPGHMNYETFVYDLLNDANDSNVLFQLEDVLSDGFLGRLPQPVNPRTSQLFAMPVPVGDDGPSTGNAMIPSWQVPTVHPMLTRPPRAQLANAARNTASTDSRPTASYTVTSNGSGQTVQIEFTTNTEDAPHILTRLLGPSAASGVMQINDSLYNDGVGHARLLVNPSNIRLLPFGREGNDSSLQDHPTSHVIPGRPLSGSLNILPTALSRWSQTSEVLEPDSTQYCLLGLRSDIVQALESRRNADIKERRAKRALEKEKAKETKKNKQAAKTDGNTAADATKTDETPTVSPPAETDDQEIRMESGAAEISTPTNTPNVTRPESPAGQQQATASADVDAIDALQQASSSLQSVSLSSNHGDEEAGAADVQMQHDESEETTSSSNYNFTGDSETSSSEGGLPRSVITTTLYSGIAHEEEAPADRSSSVDPEPVAGGGSANEAPVAAATAAAPASAPTNEFAGVDPSFLAALPDDIRQEVIREQFSRQAARRDGAENEASGVSPEFLAALPPTIQQEVLAQERAERARAQQQSTASNDPVDPTVFIQTLPSSLRQSVLADMDDSLVAVLPADLAAEAQELRANLERRQQRYIRDRLLTNYASHTFQRPNIPSGFRLPPGPVWGSIHGGRSKQQNQQNVKVQVRQLLNNDSLACLLLLLFVEEPKLNLSRLHRVLRNICFHIPTRHWLVSTLIAILQHSQESLDEEKEAEDSMDYKTTPSILVKQKPGGKQKKLPITFSSDSRNLSWLSIKLDAALGSRASIFRVVKPTRMQEIGGAKRKRYANVDCSVYIHPQASPIVCRHIVDTLLMLAKFFPQHFVSTSLRSLKNELDNRSQSIDTDFWDILLRLDSLSFSSDLPKKNAAEEKKIQELASRDIESTCMGELMRMLTHPTIKRSQQLTDRLLRLLAQISLHLPSPSSSVGKSKPDVKSADDQKDDGTNKKENSSASTLDEPQQTATMGARATTSNTSTVGQALMDTKTATTGSTQSHGSISFPSVSHEEKASVPLERELEIAVQILTSHACSEDGLEHATTLLFHLSKTQVKLRPIIIRLLLQGAQEIGLKLCEQVKQLIEQMSKHLEEDMVLDASTTPDNKKLSTDEKPTSSGASQRSNPANLVGTSGKDKVIAPGRDLQLPIMQDLTSKTSNQAFFLRILKVIIQLRSSKKEDKPIGRRPLGVRGRSWQRVFGNSSSLPFVRISREEQEAGDSALLTILESGNYDSEPSSSRQPQSSTSTNEGAIEKFMEEEDSRSLCEKLQLEDLWDNLGKCLKQLEDSNDPHAVLILQPTVEAFFLVHAPKPNSVKQADIHKDAKSQLSHLEMQPLSPSMSLESSSQQPQGSTSKDESLNSETKKFLEFADTHRSILNQILRQSNVALTEGPFSVLVNHTKVLDFDVKRQHFRQELERLEENSVSRRDDIAIRVRRQHVFEDSFRELHRRSKEELKSRLYIVFEGEEGQDAGGLLREWYLIISKEIFNPMYALFRISPGDRVTYMINPSSYINSNHLSYFKFVGGVVAKAIYDNKLLDCYFTRSFYKHILGKPVRYQDMESEDYAFSQGLVYLLENDVSAIGSELNFSVEIMEFGKTEVRDLKPSGRDLPVTEENKKEYVHLVCQEKMTGAIRQQLSAFLEGFYEIIPKRLISIFDEQELELLISGLPNIDIEDLRNNTEYHKYETTSVQIQWFWRALRSFDQAERAKFLQFVTGTSKVPLQGFAHLEGMTGAQKFQIHRDSRSTSRLPSAHTCFNQLDLPAYETYDKLRHMLLLAINECQEGFGLA